MYLIIGFHCGNKHGKKINSNKVVLEKCLLVVISWYLLLQQQKNKIPKAENYIFMTKPQLYGKENHKFMNKRV